MEKNDSPSQVFSDMLASSLTMAQAHKLMVEKNVRGVLVCDHG
jgi:hypothetical protein